MNEAMERKLTWSLDQFKLFHTTGEQLISYIVLDVSSRFRKASRKNRIFLTTRNGLGMLEETGESREFRLTARAEVGILVSEVG
jgi:hypothetical protein